MLHFIRYIRKNRTCHFTHIPQFTFSFMSGNTGNIFHHVEELLHTQNVSKIYMFVKACDLCQRKKFKSLKLRPFYSQIPADYLPMKSLSVNIKFMPKGFDNFK